MRQMWLCLGAVAQNWSQTVKLSIEFFLKFTACYSFEWMRESERERERLLMLFHLTYRIESVTVEFAIANFRTRDGILDFPCLDFSNPRDPLEGASDLGMSTEEEISLWVADAYWRHNDFNLSTFCTLRKQWEKVTKSIRKGQAMHRFSANKVRLRIILTWYEYSSINSKHFNF